MLLPIMHARHNMSGRLHDLSAGKHGMHAIRVTSRGGETIRCTAQHVYNDCRSCEFRGFEKPGQPAIVVFLAKASIILSLISSAVCAKNWDVVREVQLTMTCDHSRHDDI